MSYTMERRGEVKSGIRKLAPHCIGITLGADKIKAQQEAQAAKDKLAADALRARLQAEQQELATMDQWNAAGQAMRYSLPAVGTQLKLTPDQPNTQDTGSAHIHKLEFPDTGSVKHYVAGIVCGVYPAPHRWELTGLQFVKGLRCFLRDEDYKEIYERTNGYVEYAGLRCVEVIAHSKSGKSVIVKVV